MSYMRESDAKLIGVATASVMAFLAVLTTGLLIFAFGWGGFWIAAAWSALFAVIRLRQVWRSR
jgi:hypothetical protein